MARNTVFADKKERQTLSTRSRLHVAAVAANVIATEASKFQQGTMTRTVLNLESLGWVSVSPSCVSRES